MLTDDISVYIGHLNTVYVYSINALPIIFTKVFVGKTIFELSISRVLAIRSFLSISFKAG